MSHLWWDESSTTDPLAEDLESLMTYRERVRAVASLIVPGHGAPFVPARR